MADKAQKHHYIPEFYLKHWAGDDGRLIEFCRRMRKHGEIVVPRPTFPGGTGYQRGLYSIPGVPDEMKDIVENKYLSLADGQASEALRDMIDNRNVPVGGAKAAWIRFVLSLFHRNPEGVARSFAAIKEHYLSHNLDEARKTYAEQKRPGDPDKLEDFLELMAPKAVGQANANNLLSLISSPKVGGAVMRMHWYIVEMQGLKHPLLTSDRPVVMSNGLGNADSHLVLPVTPAHIFVAAANQEVVAKLHKLSERGQMTKRLNDLVVRQARKFVYAGNDSQLRFVENRLGEKARWSPFE